MRIQFVSAERRVADMIGEASSFLLGEADALKATLRRAETRVTQVALLMSLRAESVNEIRHM